MKCPHCGEELEDILEFKDDFDKWIGKKNILESGVTKDTFFLCVGCRRIWKLTEASIQEILEKIGITVRRTGLKKESRDQPSSEEEIIEYARKECDIPPDIYRKLSGSDRNAVYEQYIRWLLEKRKDEV
jgi:hypothetical protein